MLKIYTATIPANPAPTDCFRDIVLDALRLTGRMPARQPVTSYPEHINLNNLSCFRLENDGDGWSYCLTFETGEEIAPTTLALPREARVKDAMDAFLLGAETLCEIVTGDAELAVFALGNKLNFVALDPGPTAPSAARA